MLLVNQTVPSNIALDEYVLLYSFLSQPFPRVRKNQPTRNGICVVLTCLFSHQKPLCDRHDEGQNCLIVYLGLKGPMSVCGFLFFMQTGVPPDDSSLCHFQAWLLSFMGMLY